MKNIFKSSISKLIIIALLCCVTVPAALAYLIWNDSVKNNFTMGENTSHIEETFGSYTELEAGKSYEKNVAVRNDGSVPCYVRVFAEIEDPDVAEAISIDFNSTDWTEKQADGFYYYKKALAVSETTAPLFTTLKVKKDLPDFKMICYSETMQAYGYSDAIKAFADI